MEYRDFVGETICSFRPEIFELAKKVLIGEYLSFFIISDESVTMEILAEKACDYFEKMQLKTGKAFDKQIDSYLKAVDSIVSRRIASTPSQKKKDDTPAVVPRSRKYYEKAESIKKTRAWKVRNLLDYSRIMFCLYASVIENDFKEIQNLDYSADCIKPGKIIDAMKNERDPITISLKKKKLFNIKELYCTDTCTFIITIIILFTIMNEKVQGEYSYE